MLTLAPRACALYKVIILGVAALVDVDNPGAHGDGRGERLNWEVDEVELQGGRRCGGPAIERGCVERRTRGGKGA